MRDAVSTCTTASTIAPVASHAFAAIVEEKTSSTMSVYVELTSPSITASSVVRCPDRDNTVSGRSRGVSPVRCETPASARLH